MKPFYKNVYIRYKVGAKVLVKDPAEPQLYGKWGVVRSTIPSDEPYMFSVEVGTETIITRSSNLWSRHEYRKCKEYYEHVRKLADEAKKRKWDDTIYRLLMVEVNRTYWPVAESQ
jgi:hypothetical protein